MVVIKAASVVEVHLLGSSPNHSTERGAHTCINMFVERVLISVPQHSLLTIKWLQTVYYLR